MLSLDDQLWKELRHAYGSAENIPDLLKALASSPGPQGHYEEEPWFSLWSCLCHQGEVYSASYAAVPHLMQIASKTSGPIAPSFFHLPAAIEVARRTGRGPDIPEAFASQYQDAIDQIIENVKLHSDGAWDQAMVLSVAAAQAVAKGHIELAEALLNLDEAWIDKIRNDDFD